VFISRCVIVNIVLIQLLICKIWYTLSISNYVINLILISLFIWRIEYAVSFSRCVTVNKF
jgi:hypothetical protein